MKRTASFRLLASATVALLVTLAMWAGLAAGVFGGTQLRLSDGLFPAIAADPEILVVAVDDEALAAVEDREEEAWPWSRSVHADLVEALTADGARLVGYDVTFGQARDAAGDEALAEALEGAGNVVLGANATFEGRLSDPPQATTFDPPIPLLSEAAAGVAHVNVIPDPDGVVRALPPLIDTPDGAGYVPALSTLLLQLDEGLAGSAYTLRPEAIQIGDRLIPTGRAHLMEVNFAEGFETHSAADVLYGDVPSGTFEDKIVLVGATALGLGDHRQTPLNRASGEPGVLIHANALSTMMNGAALRAEVMPVTLALLFFLAFLSALAVAFLPIWFSPLIAAALATAYYLAAFARFDSGVVMNLVYPALAVMFGFLGALGVRYFTEERERRRVTRVFGRYVAQDVVDEVLAAPERALSTLEGASRPISVLFADLRGFTSASEEAPPEDVVRALNVYLDAMTRAVNEERGTIDKFMGDCVMAFWGAPRPTEHHAERATRAAIRMLDYIDEAKAHGEAAGLEVAGCGVGVATGEAVVGNIGSSERLDYTVVGDTVNTSSRLCGVAAAGQIVITEGCAEALGDDFRVAPLPPVVVKGKARPLRVFQVLREGQEAMEYADHVTIDSSEEKGHFQEGVEAPTKAAGYAPVEPGPDSS